MKIEKSFRLPWISHAWAYLLAAETLSKENKSPRHLSDGSKKHTLIIIPLLYCIRHAIESGLKSILISKEVDVPLSHDLQKLTLIAKGALSLEKDERINIWNEIERLAVEMNNSVYDDEKMFNKKDKASVNLRYLQTSEFGAYERLGNINHNKLVSRTKKVLGFCEILTIEVKAGFVDEQIR